MSSNMATSSKPIKVTTTYDPNELKWVKVAIKRHNIKASATNLPLERSLDNPVSISNFVHLSGSSDGELFRKITPNTVQLPVGAYSKIKPPIDRAAPQRAHERGSSRARSASVSSDEEIKQEPRPRSKEKFKGNELASTAKQKRLDLKRERSSSRGPSTGRSATQPYDSPSRHNRKSTRSGSRSPSPKASHRNSRHRSAEKRYSPARRYSPGGNGRQHSPSNSPHDRYRSPRRSKSPTAKEQVRNLSTRQGVFVPDKRKRERDSHSPSPSNHRHESSSRSRRRSRDDSRDRNRHSSRSPPPRDRHRARGDSRDRYRHGSRSPPPRDGHRNSSRERDRHRNSPRSASVERRCDERRAEFGDSPYIPYYDPALIRAPPIPFFPSPMAPFYPAHGFPPFFNRPYFPPESGFIKEAPSRPPIVYNNRKIPKFNTQGAPPRASATNAQRKKTPASNNGTITKLDSAAATAACTVTSNGGASQQNMHQPHSNSANNGVA